MVILFHRLCLLNIVCTPPTPGWLGKGGGWVIFQRDFWGRGHMGLKNSPYKKQWIRISSKKNENDCDCKLYNFSLLVSYPNKFLVVCICSLIALFSMVYTHPTDTFFFWGGAKFFSFVAWGWEDSKFLGNLLYWGDLRRFSSTKPSMINYVNSRIVYYKMISFMRVC